MNSSTRNSIAYIAGVLSSGVNSSALYDYSEGRYKFIDGRVTPNAVDIYDYNQASHVSGTGRDGHLSIYHFGSGNYIDLLVQGDRFRGYDYGSSSHFEGTIQARNVSLYDFGEGKYFNYSL